MVDRRLVAGAVIAILVAALALTGWTLLSSPGRGRSETSTSTAPSQREARPRALIADGLYVDYPNRELIDYLKGLLESHGYEVTVVLGRNVTLDVFRSITRYNVVVLRVHGGSSEVPTAEGENVTFIGLFTGVPWEPEKYAELRSRLLVTKGTPFLNPEEKYLVALPKFFKEELDGRFPSYSVVVAASCYSLYRIDIAYAMFQRGLAYYIGWGAPVTVRHMDESVKLLFKLVYEENLSWPEAVERVNRILGPDPQTTARIHIALPKPVQ